MVFVRKNTLRILLLLSMLCLFTPLNAKADTTEHIYMVVDDAELLSMEEEQGLITRMKEQVPDGNCIVFILNDDGGRSSEEDTIRYTKSQYTQYCSYTDGVAFTIDMSTRFIELVTFEGYVGQISNYQATSICDGVYKYASSKDYYSCCENAIKMIGALNGNKISAGVPTVEVPKSMHIITNLLLALVIALILNFFLLKFLSRTPEANAKSLAKSADVNILIEPEKHSKTGTVHNDHELGSIEGIICTRNWFGKLIHLICFIIIVSFRILAAAGSGSGGSGGRGGGHSSGGGRSGGGGHRF